MMWFDCCCSRCQGGMPESLSWSACKAATQPASSQQEQPVCTRHFSGIHAWHNDYYIRRIRVGKNEPSTAPSHSPPRTSRQVLPPTIQPSSRFQSPEGSIFRTESAFQLLRRVKITSEWVQGGYRSGQNANNVTSSYFSPWKRVGRRWWMDVG